MYKKIIEEMQSFSSVEKIEKSKRYFKTWKWTYSEWDIFIWTNSSDEKYILNKYKKDINLKDLEKLLNSKIHEHRRIALSILEYKFSRWSEEQKKEIYDLTIRNIDNINNWDLVDIYVPWVIWEYLEDKDKTILYDLAKSKNLWYRRIAIISTINYVKNWIFEDSIKIMKILLDDKEDLIHKATWWVLREIGKNNINELYKFLDIYSKIMPRTMLRYSIEKLDNEKRKYYMSK